MGMVKVLIHVPAPLKAQLDMLRSQGYSTSGYIRALVEQDLEARREAGMHRNLSHKKGR